MDDTDRSLHLFDNLLIAGSIFTNQVRSGLQSCPNLPFGKLV